MTGTGETKVVTNGGPGGTNGDPFLPRLVPALVPVAVLVQVSINAMTRITDARSAGRPIPPGEAWGYELTSGTAILLLLPLIWWTVARLRPSRIGWPRCIGGHVLASILFSVAHVAIMVGARRLIWGAGYDAGPIGELLPYEYRKDAWSYAVIVLIFALARKLRLAPVSAALPNLEPRVLIVQDGTRRHRVPFEAIDHILAAGNYVEVVTANERLLHRTTLTALEGELGDSFVRIHRGTLVARRAIRSSQSTAAGDFTVTTCAGSLLKGSRRYRLEPTA